MYLIWTIINAVFVILFFALALTFITKGKQLFQNKYGNAIIVILILGIISLINARKESPKNEYFYPYTGKLQKSSIKQIRTVIEDNTLFDISLMVRFRKNNEGELVPIYSRSHSSGFISGYRWNFDFAEIERINEKSYSYTVFGKLDWNLFGIRLYGQSKEITGTFTFEE